MPLFKSIQLLSQTKHLSDDQKTINGDVEKILNAINWIF